MVAVASAFKNDIDDLPIVDRHYYLSGAYTPGNIRYGLHAIKHSKKRGQMVAYET